MTLEEINKKLADIAKALDEIAWDKEMKEADKTKIEGDVNSVDAIMGAEKEFGKEQLDSYTKSVQAATEKGKDFLKDRDTSKESYSQYKSNNRKAELVKNLSGKYDDLFKKQQAIEKLEKKYDPKDLQDYANDKMKNNEVEINKKNNLVRNLGAFSNDATVKANLAEIAKNAKEINEFKKLETDIKDLTEKINDIKSALSTEKDQTAIAKGNAEIKNLEKKREKLADKKGIKYNEKTISNEINDKIDNLKKANNTCKANIVTRLSSEKADVQNAIGDLTKVEPENIIKCLNDKTLATQQEKIALRHENNRLRSNMDQMAKDLPLGEVANVQSSYAPFSYTPSDQEIKESDTYKKAMSYGMLPSDASRKDRIEWRRAYILKGKVSDGKRHPIAWLRAHLGGKRLDNKIMAEIEEIARKTATEEIIATKEQEARDKQDADQKDYEEAVGRNAFARSMYNKQAARAILEGRETTAEAEAMNNFVERNSADEPEK